MALITRLSRLFQADVHAVLDRIEEPIVMLRQAVREMEAELAEDEKQLKLKNFEAMQVEKREQEINESLQQLESELGVCFDHGKDDLARTLIRRRLEAEQVQKTLLRKHESLQQTIAASDARVAENRTRLESMRQKAELLGDDSNQQEECPATSDYPVRDEDVEIAFLREKERRNAS